MIRVKRPQRRPPALVSESREAQRAAKAFFEGRASASKREVKFADFDFPPVWLVAREDLLGLFRGKCAFCEIPVTTEGITHFRPLRDAFDLTGKSSPEHYYWLAYEWSNLYLACSVCIRNKGNRFPVLGSRAPSGTPWAKLQKQERPILLDPCLDLPEEHLVFGDKGYVASATLTPPAPASKTAARSRSIHSASIAGP
jgi:hypothetical protein